MKLPLRNLICALILGLLLTLSIPVLGQNLSEKIINFREFPAEISPHPEKNSSLELSYLQQWQLAKSRQKHQDLKGAIAAYEGLLNKLTSVRQEELNLNFPEQIEPVYREYISLLLSQSSQTSSLVLEKAIQQIDALQLAELENFLGCDLKQQLQVNQNLEQIDPKSALFYPIILPNRLEVIYKLPGQSLNSYRTFVSEKVVESTLKRLRTSLLRRNAGEIISSAAKLYEWILKPIEGQLKSIETLVFVLDGDLRNIPLAVLYDQENQQYLLEKPYALALLPSSQLFELKANPIQVQVLGGGISEPLEVGELNFSALNANQELEEIAEIVSTTTLLNNEFTQTRLKENLNKSPFSVIHLATHGNFSSDPLQTFLLAYGYEKARGELLNPNDLNNLLRTSESKIINQIELMVLSACQTALGDNRATLGLAGLAVRSGARSTLATLWQVSDESTVKLMKEFYQIWTTKKVSKAKALHQAQQQLLQEPRSQNPYYWAPYILVGNWL